MNKEGVVEAVSSAVRDGNTYYYIEIQGSDKVFVASIQMSDVLAVLKPGDTVKLGYVDSDDEFIDISELTRTAKAFYRTAIRQGKQQKARFRPRQ